MDLREFLTKRMIKNAGYKVRVFDFDGYEHMNFTLTEKTDFSKFTFDLDQQALDAEVMEFWIDNEEKEMFIYTYLEI
jgi:hypothetical protein